MTEPGFAVIAFETTGLSPKRRDRVVELAVVHLDRVGRVTGAWETMIDPERELGAGAAAGTGHGLTDADTALAPTFGQLAPSLVDLLGSRVIVAHNASFERGFLLAELDRAAYAPPRNPATLSTMELAREFLPGAGRSLIEMSAAAGIPIDDGRGASASAVATARLLESFLYAAPMWHGWSEALSAAHIDWQPLAGERVNWVPRGTKPPKAPSFLGRISAALPGHSGPMEELDYLALLDRAVADQDVTTQEADELVDLASSFGIDRDRAAHLHALFFEQLAAAAWADGTLSMDETGQLVAVGALLGVQPDSVQRAMERPAA